MKIYKIDDILSKLENCIEYKLSFSHIRFGDGGIKYIHSILHKDFKQLGIILRKEGIPQHKIIDIYEMWGYYARRADFIDTPEVYYTGKFWPRMKKPGKPINYETDQKLRDWRDLYNRAEIDNENYCNPESNCLFILKDRRNLYDVLKNRRVCVITARPEIKQILRSADIIKIVGQWENHYKNSYEYVINQIKQKARLYDVWLVAAGELGRIYSGLIKEHGGRCLDIGFVIDYLLDQNLHPRFHPFIQTSLSNPKELTLTKEGKKYEGYI